MKRLLAPALLIAGQALASDLVAVTSCGGLSEPGASMIATATIIRADARATVDCFTQLTAPAVHSSISVPFGVRCTCAVGRGCRVFILDSDGETAIACVENNIVIGTVKSFKK